MPHRISTRSWGLARPSQLNAAATHAEQRWRWPVLVVLLCTIPAFYIELIESLPTPVAIAIYLAAAAMVSLSLWRVGRLCAHPQQYLRSNALDMVLVVGLLASALLPPSAESALALAGRLFVSLLTLLRMVWALKSWVTRGGLGYLLLLALMVLLFCGVGFWVLEPRVKTPADGMWLAFTTAATVGYGDITPHTSLGKVIASFMMLLGWGILAVPTGIVTAEMTAQRERDRRARVCPGCGLMDHEAGAHFCRACGTALPSASEGQGRKGQAG